MYDLFSFDDMFFSWSLRPPLPTKHSIKLYNLSYSNSSNLIETASILFVSKTTIVVLISIPALVHNSPSSFYSQCNTSIFQPPSTEQVSFVCFPSSQVPSNAFLQILNAKAEE